MREGECMHVRKGEGGRVCACEKRCGRESVHVRRGVGGECMHVRRGVGGECVHVRRGVGGRVCGRESVCM